MNKKLKQLLTDLKTIEGNLRDNKIEAIMGRKKYKQSVLSIIDICRKASSDLQMLEILDCEGIDTLKGDK